MKQTLPWNVTGIPPEAREIARPAASREGMSVGDWLTRRILVAPLDSSAPEKPASLEQPGVVQMRPKEPRPAPNVEPDSAIRQIDDLLHFMERRLESHERAQAEASRVISAAASEIATATQGQAQAFQVLSTRIDRVERQTDTSALRDAVRGLHQGLSRLADQIAKTATESTSQIATLAGNFDGLAEQIAATRDESKQLERFVEERIATLTERVQHGEQSIAATPEFERRLKDIEERFADSRDWAERLNKVEAHLATSRREESAGKLAALERNVEQIGARLERAERQSESREGLQEAIQGLSLRVDTAEKDHSEALAELKSGLEEVKVRAREPEQIEPRAALAAPSQPAKEAEPETLETAPIAAAPARYDQVLQPPPPAQISSSPATQNYLAQVRRAAREPAVPSEDSDWNLRPRPQVLSDGKRPEPLSTRSNAASTGGANRISRLVMVAPPIAIIAGLGLLLSPYGNLLSPFGREGNELVPGVSAPSRVPDNTTTKSAQTKGAGATASSEPVEAPVAVATSDATNAVLTRIAALAAQAGSGNAKAALQLGLIYADGEGVAANNSEAARWLKQAADGGEPVAQYRLGTFYEKGRGVAASPSEALRWYRTAAERGNRRAMHNLAVAVADGTGTVKNYSEAARWFRAAAELGLTDSQFNLAVLYERGLGVEAAPAAAYRWYAIAAAAGDTEAKARQTALASLIRPAERAAADQAARNFRPRAMEAAANDE